MYCHNLLPITWKPHGGVWRVERGGAGSIGYKHAKVPSVAQTPGHADSRLGLLLGLLGAGVHDLVDPAGRLHVVVYVIR